MSRDATTAFARALVDEWTRHGITDACLSPGSRSAPMALALAGDDRIRLHVHLDERSASFFALGIARATGRPAIVLCTSGTAAANFHPAVLEAHHGRVPLVACTADRPPELRDAGAGQTVDQAKLYGDAVRWYCDPGVPDDRPGVGAEWRALASRAVAEALGPPAGPVHLNLPFREPLVPTGAPLVDAQGRGDGRPWTARAFTGRAPAPPVVDALAELIRAQPRGLIVSGWGAAVEPRTLLRFAAAAGWPVLADPISNLRVPGTISTYDPIARVGDAARRLRPDVVLRLGALPTNKPVAQWLAPEVAQVLVDPDDAWLDPQHAAGGRLTADPEPLLVALTGVLAADGASREATGWLEAWRAADRAARGAIDDVLDSSDAPFEGRVARDVVAAVPDGTSLVVASSMPVRDVESFASGRTGVRFHANRGVNGIDGFVSTALGIAASRPEPVPTLALLGDLCFVHDAGGLLGATERRVDLTFVVLDNDGGGIFSFLPQADLPEHFERCFGTPHGLDLAALAAVHGIPTVDVDSASGLGPALRTAIVTGGLSVVRVRTQRVDNVRRHREVWAEVSHALADA
jgi:2-succinyl-5-enolpyruvyl-6-hydroxy-3-cyclohexene-1-carboxylate synthase